MTVITKAIGEKKPSDKMKQPLVPDDIAEANGGSVDPESQLPAPGGSVGPYAMIKDQVFILRRGKKRPNFLTVYCLAFTAILGMSTGLISGLYVYRHYARDQMHRFRTGWYSIPYEQGTNRLPIDREGLIAGAQPYSDNYRINAGEDLDSSKSLNSMSKYFKERFEIDLDKDYEEIDVPDFRNGRRGRFIHDFNTNLTSIIDIDGQACFLMPLNHERVLPPRNMYDLLNKMYDGYYEVNTEVVRETMQAVFPPMTDLSNVGTYIQKECKHMRTYMLEKVNYTGIAKRSVSDGLYGHFAGKSIDEWEIVNLDRVLASN